MTEHQAARPSADTPLSTLPDLESLSRYGDGGRQYPLDHAAVEAAAALADERLASADEAGDRAAALALLGYLGNAHRLLGETDLAARLLQRALILARELGNVRAEAVTLIRLGEADRYGGNLDPAEPLYRDALTLVQANPVLLGNLEDFALQHLGKCRLEQGDAVEAVACLERALDLRRTKGDSGLIASTEAALALAQAARHEATTAQTPGTGCP